MDSHLLVCTDRTQACSAVCLGQVAEVSVEPLLKVSLGEQMKQAKEQVKAWKSAVDVRQKAKDERKCKEAACQEQERAAWKKQGVEKKAQTAQETEETVVAHDSSSNASVILPSSGMSSSAPFMMNMLPKVQITIPCRKEVSLPLSVLILTDCC